MASPFAAFPFLIQFCEPCKILSSMAWNPSWSRSSWSVSNRQDNSTPTWNNWGRQQTPNQPSIPENPVQIAQSFNPDPKCCDANAFTGKKFYRNIQSTPWPSKAGLPGKTSAVCVSSMSPERVSTTMPFASSVSNLLRLIRQDRIDLDKTASHLHGPAPPDKHRESARFMEPLLAADHQTFGY